MYIYNKIECEFVAFYRMAGGNLIKAKKNGGFSTRGMFPCSKCHKEFQGKDQARDHENNCKGKVIIQQN